RRVPRAPGEPGVRLETRPVGYDQAVPSTRGARRSPETRSKGASRELFERFTERARQVVVLAQDEARALKHNYIGTEHILLGLLREGEGLAALLPGLRGGERGLPPPFPRCPASPGKRCVPRSRVSSARATRSPPARS